jgi:CYTH domain-containing protein
LSLKITRKWLLSQLPDVSYQPACLLEQFYVKTENNSPLRFRKIIITQESQATYWQNRKRGQGLVTIEQEIQITEQYYNQMLTKKTGRIICKIQSNHLARDEYGREYILETQLYLDDLENMLIAKCNFSTIHQAEKFKLPKIFFDYVINEITGNFRYSNEELAISGLPLYHYSTKAV